MTTDGMGFPDKNNPHSIREIRKSVVTHFSRGKNSFFRGFLAS